MSRGMSSNKDIGSGFIWKHGDKDKKEPVIQDRNRVKIDLEHGDEDKKEHVIQKGYWVTIYLKTLGYK